MHGYAPGWRMWVAPATMMLCTLLGYIDRQVLAVLSPTILEDTGMLASEYANAVAVFSLLYTLMNPVCGSILDYIGLRRGMLIAVAIWTAASVAHAWVGAFVGFAMARAVLGFGEGAAFPGALRTSTEALPPEKQARGLALGYSGASMGALITPPLVTPIAAAYGWRVAFLLTGVLGLLWMLLWWRVARPPYLPEHKHVTSQVRWPDFRERRLWVVVSSFGLGGMALGVVAYLSPLYLNRALGLTQDDIGNYFWIPFVGWELGYFFWAWVSDRFAPREARPVKTFLVLTILTLPSAFVTLTDSWVVVIGLLTWANFVATGFVVTSLRVGACIFPPDRVGMVAGIGSGSWGAVQALMLFLYGKAFDREMYTLVFVSMALLPMLGTAAWLWLSKPWASTPAPEPAPV